MGCDIFPFITVVIHKSVPHIKATGLPYIQGTADQGSARRAGIVCALSCVCLCVH